MGNDKLWLRGEIAPRTLVTVLAEGAKTVTYSDKDGSHEVDAWRVRQIAHGDSPAELDVALDKLAQADFAGAETILGGLAGRESPAWLAPHAGFLHANARRLRAEL